MQAEGVGHLVNLTNNMTTANVISKVKNFIASALQVPSFAPALA